ncbi:MAG: proton-conducting membrane transporter, partial [Thermoguttaceae bacterium]|nr:proton-conducting membrane transporter [Thermoguttaceae bacterium]
MTPGMVPEVLADFLRQHANGQAKPRRAPGVPPGPVTEVRVGLGSCCVAQGSGKVHQALGDALAEAGAAAVVKRVGCVGMCHQTPLVEIVPPGGQPAKLFAKVDPETARELVLSHFKPKGILKRVGLAVTNLLDRLFTDETGDALTHHALDVRDGPVCAFLGRQKRLATEYSGQLDPTDLDEYLRHGGFQALRRCLALAPDEIIAEVRASGLRGRGGAGFPTGVKWAKVRSAPAEPRYVVCNGDEGD